MWSSISHAPTYSDGCAEKAKEDQKGSHGKGVNTHVLKKPGTWMMLTSRPAVCLQSGEPLGGSISKARAHTSLLLGPIPGPGTPTFPSQVAPNCFQGLLKFSPLGLAQLFMHHGQRVDVWTTAPAHRNAKLLEGQMKPMVRAKNAAGTGLGQGPGTRG